MSYVGNTPTQQAFTPAVDYFSGNGSTVAFTLSRPVASVAQVQVNVNNVAQNPSTAFTVNGNTITFTGAPSSGTNNIYVQYTSPITQVIQPGQGTVGATQLASGLAFSQWTTTGSNIYYNTGSVGIGTSSPSSPLAIGRVNSIEEGGQIDLCRSSDNASAWGIDVYGSTSTPSLRFIDNVASATRLSIDGSGNFLVGTTSSTGGKVESKSGSAGGECYRSWNATDSGTRYFHYFGVGSASFTNVGAITSNGSTTTYATSSDYRLKENVQPMTGALAKVAALKPCTYTWTGTQLNDEGFIAHELQEVCPSAVIGEKDAVDADGNPQYQGIDTSFLVATLTAAIQEQQALITTLTERLDALEAE